MRYSLAIASLAVLALVTGCAGGEAYVEKTWEYDRESSNFPNGPTLVEGSAVTVCYAKSATSPQAIFKLADDECGRFGMTAALEEQVYTYCPMNTPVAAQFSCRAKVASTQPAGAAAGQTPASSFMPSTGAYAKGSVLPEGFGAGSVSTTAKSEAFPTFLFNDPNRPAQ